MAAAAKATALLAALSVPFVVNEVHADLGDELRAALAAAISAPHDATKRAHLEARLTYIVALDAYVFEGDLLVTRADLRDRLVRWHDDRKRIAMAKGDIQGVAPDPDRLKLLTSPELKVNRKHGRDDIWSKEKRRNLTYAIDRASFPDSGMYATVKDNLERAAIGWQGEQGWEQLCANCEIDFNHVRDNDESPSFDKVLFIVKYFDAEGEFIATAPSPSTPSDRRFLYVDPSYFNTDYDPVGIFRHELGHVLGYRHEHLDQLSGCYTLENEEVRSLSPYDRDSVMHYFCNDKGGHMLGFSDIDRSSHAELYKP